MDIVLDGKPIEVKYKNNIGKEDLKGILRFMKVFKSKEGVIITKDIFKEEEFQSKKILLVPAWLFSLSSQISS
ncbi:MAG: hypothetical protein ACPLYW_02530 [Candidatus Nanoarchaeia archaeon]